MSQPSMWFYIRSRTSSIQTLLQALRVDSEASAHAKDDIVGLDFDPFIGSQDPANRYEARNATLPKQQVLG